MQMEPERRAAGEQNRDLGALLGISLHTPPLNPVVVFPLSPFCRGGAA